MEKKRPGGCASGFPRSERSPRGGSGGPTRVGDGMLRTGQGQMAYFPRDGEQAARLKGDTAQGHVQLCWASRAACAGVGGWGNEPEAS